MVAWDRGYIAIPGSLQEGQWDKISLSSLQIAIIVEMLLGLGYIAGGSAIAYYTNRTDERINTIRTSSAVAAVSQYNIMFMITCDWGSRPSCTNLNPNVWYNPDTYFPGDLICKQSMIWNVHSLISNDCESSSHALMSSIHVVKSICCIRRLN